MFSTWQKYQRELRAIRTNLTPEQEDGLLAELYQSEAFRLYCNKRENAIIVAMANRKPSDDEHLKMQGRRTEIMELFYAAKAAFHRVDKRRRESKFAKGRLHESPQAPA